LGFTHSKYFFRLEFSHSKFIGLEFSLSKCFLLPVLQAADRSNTSKKGDTASHLHHQPLRGSCLGFNCSSSRGPGDLLRVDEARLLLLLDLDREVEEPLHSPYAVPAGRLQDRHGCAAPPAREGPSNTP